MTRSELCPRHRDAYDHLRSMMPHWPKPERQRWRDDTARACRACQHLAPAVLPYTSRDPEET